MNIDNISDYISIAIGILGLIIAIWPLVTSKAKYFDYPFVEYDKAESNVFSKSAALMWKANWTVASLIILVAYINVIRSEIGLPYRNSSRDFLTIYFIQTVSIIIKDLFHNVFAYKAKTEKLFKKIFDSTGSLMIFILMEGVTLFIVGMLSFVFQVIDYYSGLLIMLAVLSAFFCFFRMNEEMANLIHLHRVKNLTIVMADGTIYGNITEYRDLGKTVRISNTLNKVVFLSKDTISIITKELGKRNVLEIVREKVTKKNIEVIPESED